MKFYYSQANARSCVEKNRRVKEVERKLHKYYKSVIIFLAEIILTDSASNIF